MFLALTGNLLLIFIVASKPETRTLTGFLFVNMAAADLLVTFIAMPVTVATSYTDLRWLQGILGQITCKVVHFSFHVSIVASILSLMLMAVDRFLGVVFPFHLFPSFRRAKLLTGLIWLISMIAMIPAALLWDTKKGEPKGLYCQPDFENVFGDFKKGVMVFFTYLFLLAYLIPLLVISVLYGMVCRKLWRQNASLGSKLSTALEKWERHEESKRIVRMLVIVTAAFALCWLPAQTYHLILAFNIDLHFSLPRYVMFVCMWCGHANSAFNPWLYMLLTNKFRMALGEVLLRNRSESILSDRPMRGRSSTKLSMIIESVSVQRLPEIQIHQELESCFLKVSELEETIV